MRTCEATELLMTISEKDHLWKEPWRRFSLAAFLVWSVCRCRRDTQKHHPVKLGPRWVYPGRRPQRQEKSRHQRPKHGPRHVLLGHRGSTYYWTAGTRLPPEKQTQKSPPCQGSAAKNELLQLKSFKFFNEKSELEIIKSTRYTGKHGYWQYSKYHVKTERYKRVRKETVWFLSKRREWWGAWVAQSVKLLTLDFSSSQDLRVVRSSLTWGSAPGHGVCLTFSLFLSFCPSHCLPPKEKKEGRERKEERKEENRKAKDIFWIPTLGRFQLLSGFSSSVT